MKKKYLILVLSLLFVSFDGNSMSKNDSELCYLVDSLNMSGLIFQVKSGHCYLVDLSDNLFIESYAGEDEEYFIKSPYAYIFEPKFFSKLDMFYGLNMDKSPFAGHHIEHKKWFDNSLDKYWRNVPDTIIYPVYKQFKHANGIMVASVYYEDWREPDYYYLFLVRGDFYNYITVSCVFDGPYHYYIPFPDPKAYYKVVVPVWEEIPVRPEDDD